MGLRAVERADPVDEADLIAACVRGDAAAERTLFRREYGRVNATVYRILGSLREADDLVQETFIAVFRALPRFRGEAKLSTWIDRIAVRVVFQHIGARKPASVSLEMAGEAEDDGGTTDDRAQAREGLRRLYAALAALKPDARVAFALHMIDGRSVAEVAALTGTTSVAAKLRIWRARREIDRHAAADPVLSEYFAAGRGGEREP